MENLKGFSWSEAIQFLQKYTETKTEDTYAALVWKKLQMGHRTQDILMDIAALKSIQEEGVSATPEWQSAIKWLAYQRSQQKNLRLDLLWAQLETGDRTSELLQLIREEAAKPQNPIPASPVPELVSVDNTPPTPDF